MGINSLSRALDRHQNRKKSPKQKTGGFDNAIMCIPHNGRDDLPGTEEDAPQYPENQSSMLILQKMGDQLVNFVCITPEFDLENTPTLEIYWSGDRTIKPGTIIKNPVYKNE